MKLFIFDLNGTLSRLPSPTVYLTLLRAQEEGCKIVLWSGMDPYEIRRCYPGLLNAVDSLWEKPCRLRMKLETAGWEPLEVVVVDDDPTLRKAAARGLRDMPFQTTVLEPSAVGDLVRLPDE